MSGDDGYCDMRRLISSGSTFERDIGYSRAVVDGEWVFVSGTTGFDYAAMTIAGDVAVQCRQCLRNIGAALAEAGSSFAEVVRVRYILPDRDDFPACWPALRRVFGEVRPAATMIVAGLADPRMRIEIEVTARRRSGRPRTQRVQRDAGSHGDVEALDARRDGDAGKRVAVRGDKPAQAGTLRAQHQHRARIGRQAVEAAAGGTVEAHRPEPMLLQLLQRLRQVGDLDQRHKVEAAGGRPGRRTRKLGRAALGNDDRVDRKGRRTAQDGADVARVAELVERKQQRRALGRDDVAQREDRQRPGLQGQPLVKLLAAHPPLDEVGGRGLDDEAVAPRQGAEALQRRRRRQEP